MRLLSLPVLIALSLVVLPAAAGIALYRAWLSGNEGIPEQMPARTELKAGPAARCPHCGRIESKRKLGADAAAPRAAASYEYTLRMADGSSRVFQERRPVSWRLGERLIYIDGVQALARPVVAATGEY
jgi:hypothetical protein